MMSGSSVNSAGSRCVLWHAPGVALPSDLVISLERRGVRLSSCTSAYAAIAQVCLHERANDERTDDPAQRESLVLVLVTPKQLAQPAEVVDAMRRYASRTACWWYDPSANPRLRAVVDADVEQWLAEGVRSGQPVVIRPRAGDDVRPRLKLSGDVETPDEGITRLRTDAIGGDPAPMPHTRIEGLRHGAGGVGGQ
jgi:hypothetical protein